MRRGIGGVLSQDNWTPRWGRTELAGRQGEGDSDQRGEEASGRVRCNAFISGPYRNTLSDPRTSTIIAESTSGQPRSFCAQPRTYALATSLRGERDIEPHQEEERYARPRARAPPSTAKPPSFLLAKSVGRSGNLVPIRQAVLKIGRAGNVGTRIRVRLGGSQDVGTEPLELCLCWTDGARDVRDSIGFGILGLNWRRLDLLPGI